MNTLIVIAFIIGYLFITIENKIHINKAAIAILTAIQHWLMAIRFLWY